MATSYTNQAHTVDAVRPARRRRKLVTWTLVLVVIFIAACAVLFQVGLWRGRVAIDARRNDVAKRWLSMTGLCWRKNAEWYYLNAIVNRRSLDFDAVERNLKKAHELGWPVSELERQQNLAFIQTGQFQQIGNKWSELFLSAGSDGPEICKAYVDYALSRFRADEAATVIEGWKTDFPDDPEPYVTEGTINSVLLAWSRAETSFREALEIDPTNDEARIKLADALIQQLKFSEADAELRKVSKSSATEPHVISALAHCVAQQGRLDEALDSLEEALEEKPSDETLLRELGRLQLMQGENEEAIAALTPVLESHPEDTEIRYALAQALRNHGEEQAAQQHFRLVDEGTKALRELSRLTAHVTQNPADVETRFKIGSVTWKWKSRRDGVAWLQSVLEFSPKHTPTHKLLAQHYEESGDRKKAKYHKKMSEGDE
ncbi:tetratricopeptide repeat protein [Fuerstiella marisgermanici]|uniref:Tetratricopeptide repeat protein n=1 Tax=Fuerstiella marisgermanici TaxID=1891926 RepID=A0A1P8WF82_9PLAN|nr:tetratricopeptide repeat protein [Fuerstiella marisgermanici]APZ92700.1 tetratricopeptide repeat protein [Fuerstiella marisgermanici]